MVDYEAAGQPLAAHVGWMHSRGYKPGSNAQIWLPHDGVTHDKVYQVTYQSELEKAGYDVTVVKKSGRICQGRAYRQSRRQILSALLIRAACLEALRRIGITRGETRTGIADSVLSTIGPRMLRTHSGWRLS